MTELEQLDNCRRAGQWKKSSRSYSHGACVEVRRVEKGVEVRDSKDPSGPILPFTCAQWKRFVAWLKRRYPGASVQVGKAGNRTDGRNSADPAKVVRLNRKRRVVRLAAAIHGTTESAA